jgi:TIR domain
MTKRVFISYRREDTAPEAGRLYDRFGRLLGKKNVFLDVGAIDAGENFEEKIRAEITKADAILVLIGKRWMAPASGEEKPRLWNERDHVRAEVRASLQSKALVLPVLVDDAPMADAALLPEDIAGITKRNAPPLRSNTFDSDANLIARKALGMAPSDLLWNKPPLSRKIGSAIGGGVLAFVALFILGLAHMAILHRSIQESLGGQGQMEILAGGLLILGLVLGFLYGSRWRSLI